MGDIPGPLNFILILVRPKKPGELVGLDLPAFRYRPLRTAIYTTQDAHRTSPHDPKP